MIFSAVVFDLDGTLLNTVPGLARSMNEVLMKYNFPTHSEEEYKRYIGNGIKALVEQSVPAGTEKELIKAMYREKSLLYDTYWKSGTTVYPGVVELLTTLKERSIVMAIVSSKEDYFTQKIVQHFFGQYIFVAVIGRTDSIPKKPDPTGTVSIIQHTKIPKDRWCLVGDKDVDIETAHNAGITPLWAQWGYQKEAPKGVVVLKSPKNLLQHLTT